MTIPTKELSAIAFAAYRINNGLIRDSKKWDDATESFVAATPNRVLVRNTAAQVEEELTVTVTDDDRKQAELAISALNNDILIKTLTNKKISDFLLNLNRIVSNETASLNDCGIIVFLPQIFDTVKIQQVMKAKMFDLTASSKYIGNIDEKVTIDFTVIEHRFLQDYDCYSVFGHDNNGNCVAYFTRKSELTESGKIIGKVKSHKRDSYHNDAIVTTINYVKRI